MRVLLAGALLLTGRPQADAAPGALEGRSVPEGIVEQPVGLAASADAFSEPVTFTYLPTVLQLLAVPPLSVSAAGLPAAAAMAGVLAGPHLHGAASRHVAEPVPAPPRLRVLRGGREGAQGGEAVRVPAGAAPEEAAQALGALGGAARLPSEAGAAVADAVIDGRGDSRGPSEASVVEADAAALALHRKALEREAALAEVQSSPRRVRVILPGQELNAVMTKTPYSRHSEGRSAALALAAADPDEAAIMVTSLPMEEDLQGHLLHGLPDPSGTRDRIRFYSFGERDDADPRKSFTQKLLRRADVLGAVARAVAEFRERGFSAFVDPYNVTSAVEAVAEFLGLPVYGALAEHWVLGHKSIGRALAERVGLTVVRGINGIPGGRTFDALTDAIVRLRRATGDKKIVLKAEDGASGEGNRFLVFRGPNEPGTIATKLAREAASHRHRAYFQTFQGMGGVLEQFIEGAAHYPSPSIQLRIGPGRQVFVESTHDQILKNGAWVGARYPADVRYRRALHEAGLRVGRALAEQGVLGNLGVDFMAIPAQIARDRYGMEVSAEELESGWKLVYVETNLRKTGTTYPFRLAMHLTGARVNEEGLLERLDGGGLVAYEAYTGEDGFPGLALTSRSEFLAAFHRSGLAFDPGPKAGVVMDNPRAIFSPQTAGKISYVAIAGDAQGVADLKRRFLEWLREYELGLVLRAAGDRLEEPRDADPFEGDVEVVRGALTFQNLALAKASGGRVHLVLENGWLSKGGERLGVRRSLRYDPAADAFVLASYRRPLRASYYVAADQAGAELGSGLAIPVAGRTVEDRLLARGLAAAAGVDVPTTLFIPGSRHAVQDLLRPGAAGIGADMTRTSRRGIRGALADWIARSGERVEDSIVIRTSQGGQERVFQGARGRLAEIVEYVLDLLDELGSSGAVMVESGKVWDYVFDVPAAIHPSGRVDISPVRMLYRARSSEGRRRPLLEPTDASGLRGFDPHPGGFGHPENESYWRKAEAALQSAIEQAAAAVRAYEERTLPANVRTDFLRVRVALMRNGAAPRWVLLDLLGHRDRSPEVRRARWGADLAPQREEAEALAVQRVAAMSARADAGGRPAARSRAVWTRP
ncbi:MAG: hypothetical protein HY552_04215 [Elusimicrobia bacterium]|nr:hypothetical protein [Elusimicrobiota bacterium]